MVTKGSNTLGKAVAVAAVVVAGACTASSAPQDVTLEDELLATAAEVAEQGVAIQDAIVVCMKAEGFDYTPMQFQPPPRSIPLSDYTILLSNREEWSEHGYGYANVSLKPFAEGEVATIETQSPAYNRALNGSPPDEPGCGQKAFDDFGTLGEVLVAKAEELTDIQEGVVAELESLPESAAWAQCMSENGFPISSLGDPAMLVGERHWEVLSGVMPAGQMALDVVFNESTQRFEADDQAITDALDELYRIEIEVAAVDYQCSSRLYPLAREIYDEALNERG